MEKMGLIKNNERMGKYELEQGFASYKTIVDYFIGDAVLCNNIIDVDASVYENLEIEERYFNENAEEITQEEYFKDDNAYCDSSAPEFYQYFVCNLSKYDREQAKKAGLTLSYSDMLDCDVLCVDHCGTSWDYVLTSVKLFDEYEDLQKWESSNDEN